MSKTKLPSQKHTTLMLVHVNSLSLHLCLAENRAGERQRLVTAPRWTMNVWRHFRFWLHSDNRENRISRFIFWDVECLSGDIHWTTPWSRSSPTSVSITHARVLIGLRCNGWKNTTTKDTAVGGLVLPNLPMNRVSAKIWCCLFSNNTSVPINILKP